MWCTWEYQKLKFGKIVNFGVHWYLNREAIFAQPKSDLVRIFFCYTFWVNGYARWHRIYGQSAVDLKTYFFTCAPINLYHNTMNGRIIQHDKTNIDDFALYMSDAWHAYVMKSWYVSHAWQAWVTWMMRTSMFYILVTKTLRQFSYLQWHCERKKKFVFLYNKSDFGEHEDLLLVHNYSCQSNKHSWNCLPLSLYLGWQHLMETS